MRFKYFLGCWICVLLLANGFAQADILNLAVPITDSTSLSAATDNDSTAIVTPINVTAINATEAIVVVSANSFFGGATYYAKKFEGRKTATGETFRHTNYTAASNKFKLNTWVRVTNIKNGKCVIVRINDRMAPSMSAKGRIVDLTYTAAKEIGIINIGVGKVKVEIIDKPASE